MTIEIKDGDLIVSGRKRLTASDLAANNMRTESQPWNLSVISVCLYHEEREPEDTETLKAGNVGQPSWFANSVLTVPLLMQHLGLNKY